MKTFEQTLEGYEHKDSALRVLKFCQSCKLKIGKPKVMKSSGTFEYGGRYIKLDMTLSTPDSEVKFSEPSEVELFKVWNEHVIEPCLPQIFAGVYIHHIFYSRAVPYIDGKAVTEAFSREVGESWYKIVDEVRAHAKDVESRLAQIVSDHLQKHGNKEKKALQEKFFKYIKESEELAEADPKVILAVLRLGWDNIDILRSFASRNVEDSAAIELNDIVQAQNLAKAESVMKS